jgi:biopolymer transport protein ExbB
MFTRLVGSIALTAALCTASLHAQAQDSASAPSAAPATTEAPAAPPAPSAAAVRPPVGQNNAIKVDNPYGIGALWMQSDLVAKFVLVMLAVMSAASWYVIVVKLLDQRKIKVHGKAAANITESAEQLLAAAENLAPVSPYRRVVAAGFEALRKHARVAAKVSLDDWISQSTDRAVDRAQRQLQFGLAVLATVGSTAPFVGLFGTVWGIYHALTAIGVAGQASIDKVAGPVGEALIMTAIGLAVAVPAVLGYNWLVRRNKVVMDNLRDFSSDVHSALLAA